MFADTAEVFISSGKGGNGCLSFRHEKYVDKGGPDGGDGGKGGDVIFVGDINVNTLADFRFKPELRAENGKPGGKQKMRGANGADKIVHVPLGTVIHRDSGIIAELTTDGQRVVVARGGQGGFGNFHFKSSVRRTPKVAEVGEPAESFFAKLELKTVADVGLVGLPNAGKSTLLSIISNARPAIADYPFTTLTPNLGVATVRGDFGTFPHFDKHLRNELAKNPNILIADIPGLIEGASEGKGLGDEFLRHIERVKVIVHVIDINHDYPPINYLKIRRELQAYSPDLAAKPEIVVLTKIDLVEDAYIDRMYDKIAEYANADGGMNIHAISAVSGEEGREDLEYLLADMFRACRGNNAGQVAETSLYADDSDDEYVVSFDPARVPDDDWRIIPLSDDSFLVTGSKIERFAARTDFTNPFGVERLRNIMKRFGIVAELRRLGATPQATIRISDFTFTLVDTFYLDSLDDDLDYFGDSDD